MNPKSLSLLLLAAAVALPACSGGTKKKTELAPTITGSGPAVTEGPIPDPPPPAVPNANQTVWVARIVDKATGKPIGGVRCMLVREVPEPLYMREPARRNVMWEYKTPKHGVAATPALDISQEPAGMRYLLISGPGFAPMIEPIGEVAGGKTYDKTFEVTITPQVKFIVRLPNGDRAKNAICTMKLDEDAPAVDGKMASRGSGSGNVGTTERADDLGEVTFNRAPGTYRLEFSEEKGRNRYYAKFEWSGTQGEAEEVQLPAKSMEKPW